MEHAPTFLRRQQQQQRQRMARHVQHQQLLLLRYASRSTTAQLDQHRSNSKLCYTLMCAAVTAVLRMVALQQQCRQMHHVLTAAVPAPAGMAVQRFKDRCCGPTCAVEMGLG